VVIVAHNEGGNLRSTVEHFLDSAAPNVELIVVDDSSTDESVQFLSEPEYRDVTVRRPPVRMGVAGARNFGARSAQAECVVFSDAHVAPQRRWLDPLLDALDDCTVGAVAPTISVMGNEAQKGYGFTWRDPSLGMAWLDDRPSNTTQVPFLCGCFFATRKRVFENCGRFDEGLVTWGFEDAEYSLRLWLSGYSCLVEPAAEVAHLFRPTFPYQVHWETTIHNQVRTALLHLSPKRLNRVIRYARNKPEFDMAYVRLVQSDVWQRRDFVQQLRTRTDDWFFDQFSITALADD
jgi:GT2 family glycosyltransferase